MAYESKWNQISPSHLHFRKGHVPTRPTKYPSAANWLSKISGHSPWSKTHLAHPHICKAKTTRPQTPSPPNSSSTKPSWNPYGHNGIQLWGTASDSNIDILERFQSKVLRIITDAPWYVPNAVIKHDLQVPSVRQEVWTYSVTYHARLEGHPNDLATSLLQKPLIIVDSSGTTLPT